MCVPPILCLGVIIILDLQEAPSTTTPRAPISSHCTKTITSSESNAFQTTPTLPRRVARTDRRRRVTYSLPAAPKRYLHSRFAEHVLLDCTGRRLLGSCADSSGGGSAGSLRSGGWCTLRGCWPRRRARNNIRSRMAIFGDN